VEKGGGRRSAIERERYRESGEVVLRMFGRAVWKWKIIKREKAERGMSPGLESFTNGE